MLTTPSFIDTIMITGALGVLSDTEKANIDKLCELTSKNGINVVSLLKIQLKYNKERFVDGVKFVNKVLEKDLDTAETQEFLDTVYHVIKINREIGMNIVELYNRIYFKDMAWVDMCSTIRALKDNFDIFKEYRPLYSNNKLILDGEEYIFHKSGDHTFKLESVRTGYLTYNEFFSIEIRKDRRILAITSSGYLNMDSLYAIVLV